jgi:ParB family chromosome partitioning protein
MVEFLQRFIDDTLGRIEEFRRDGKTEDASDFAQSLERTALFLGATALAAAAQDLRGALAQPTGQGDSDHAAAEALRDKLDRVAQELQALGGRRNGPPSAPAEDPSSRSATDAPTVGGGDARNIRLAVDDIRVGARLRGLDEAKVAMLESSMRDIGLQTPITVAADEAGGWCLVAGMHRLEATRRLGRTDIACLVIDRSEPAARLWEIDENLVRSELTQLERDQHLLRRKQIFDEWVVGETGRSPPGLGGRGNKGFATDTEDKTGIAKRRVNESVRRATRIADEVQDAVRQMPAADIRVELDALASLDREQQKLALAKVERGDAVNFRAAGRQIRGVRENDETERRFKELQSAWQSAGAEARARFLRWLRGTAKTEVLDLPRWSEDHPPDRSREGRERIATPAPEGHRRLRITHVGPRPLDQ